VLGAVGIEIKSSSCDPESSTNNGDPDDQSSAFENKETIKESYYDASYKCIVVYGLRLFDVLGIFLYVIESKVANEVIIGIQINAWRQFVDVWETETMDHTVGAVSYVTSTGLGVFLFAD